jgi:hypothetical protein
MVGCNSNPSCKGDRKIVVYAILGKKLETLSKKITTMKKDWGHGSDDRVPASNPTTGWALVTHSCNSSYLGC